MQVHGKQFCSEWYQRHPWLILCITHFTAFCSTCQYCYKLNLLTNKLGEATLSQKDLIIGRRKQLNYLIYYSQPDANYLHQVVNNISDHESVFSDDEFKKIFWDQQMCNKNNNKFIPFMQYFCCTFIIML